jgi:hypothetical protein
MTNPLYVIKEWIQIGLELAPAHPDIWLPFSRESTICNRWQVSLDTRPLNGRQGIFSPAGKVSF